MGISSRSAIYSLSPQKPLPLLQKKSILHRFLIQIKRFYCPPSAFAHKACFFTSQSRELCSFSYPILHQHIQAFLSTPVSISTQSSSKKGTFSSFDLSLLCLECFMHSKWVLALSGCFPPSLLKKSRPTSSILQFIW